MTAYDLAPGITKLKAALILALISTDVLVLIKNELSITASFQCKE